MTTESDSVELVQLNEALKQAQSLQNLSINILGLLNQGLSLSETLEQVVAAIKCGIGVDAVGIRLQSGEDFPYHAHDGFSTAFLRTENVLISSETTGEACRDEHGKPRLDCTCGLVISGQTDPTNPFFTLNGSYWLNRGRVSPAFPNEHNDPRLNARDRCLHDGYNSVALIPIRAHKDIIGLLQLNDRQQDRFTLAMIQFFEGVASGIGLVLMRQQAQTALHKREEQYRLLFTNMTEGFALHEIICDADGNPVDYRFLDVNPAFERMTGIKIDAALGKTVRQLLPHVEASWIETYGRVALSGESVVIEDYSAELQCHYRVVAFCPQLGQFAVVIEDVSERKRTEESLREQHTELERFTYAVSHDLKSPLVTIRTFLAYMEEDLNRNDASSVEKDMGFIRNAADKMSLLLDELQKLSQIGRITCANEDVLVQTAVREALDLVAGRLAMSGVTVTVTDEPVLLSGDRRRLVELFQNLLDNAAKFTRNQSNARVQVGAESTPEGLLLFVRDNGIGFEPQQHERLFDLFHRLDPTVEGTGIGLALARRIVHLHGGKIWAESAGPGTGATFKFTLANTRRVSGGVIVS